MRYSTLIAVLQLTGLAQATPALPLNGLAITPPNNQGTPPSIDSSAVAKRSPTELLSLAEIGSAEHNPNASGLQKRALNLKLLYSTDSAYRATYNGIAIILHIFYDLVINQVIFSWNIDGTTPAPGTLSFGFKDTSTGVGIPARAYTHDTRYELGSGLKGHNIINIFKG